MSLAEDLLNSLPEDRPAAASIDPATEPHIVINADKTVTVPEELKHIAVQGEHNIETVTFDCPRYWDGHDLSQMSVRINFQRPDGHREPHLAENLRVDDTDTSLIHFDWTISGNVTAVKGNISFMVCAKIADAEGVTEREWHSRLNQDLVIDEGLDCSGDEIVEQNPDIIESILVQLDELKSTDGTGSGSGENVNGLTAAERSTLIAIVNAIGTFSVPNGQELMDAFNAAWGGSGSGGDSGGDTPGSGDDDTGGATVVNLFDKNTMIDDTHYVNGQGNFGSTSGSSKAAVIPVSANTTYALQFGQLFTNFSKIGSIAFYDASKNKIAYVNAPLDQYNTGEFKDGNSVGIGVYIQYDSSGKGYTFTTAADTAFLAFTIILNNDTSIVDTTMLEAGSVCHDYVPYKEV